MTTRSTRLAGIALAAGLGISTLAACGGGGSSGGGSDTGGGGGGGGGKKIALLLPESKTTRYETFDRPLFEAAIKADCADCTIIYSNADQDAAKQQQQAEAALTQGANVLVLDPVDGKAAAAVVAQRQGPGRPGRRLRPVHRGASTTTSPSTTRRSARLQAQTLVDILKKGGKTSGDVVMINGSPTDPNAADFKKGAHSVLDSSGYKVAAEYDTPDWSPDKAQAWMEGQISAVKGNLVGVYAANDGTAGGAIAALKGGGVTPLPPVTGQDAELAAIQRILAGDQAMTIYKPIKPEADGRRQGRARPGQQAEAAVDRRTSRASRRRSSTRSRSPRPTSRTPSSRTASTRSNDICAGSFAAACSAAGLS